jgi:hypothetical protein
MSMYAAFLEFRHSPSRGNSPDDIFQDVFTDHGFLSNFREDLISTALHAAPAAQSYSIQYLGTKIWIFLPPSHHNRFHIFNFPSSVPEVGSEAEYFLSKVHSVYCIILMISFSLPLSSLPIRHRNLSSMLCRSQVTSSTSPRIGHMQW